MTSNDALQNRSRHRLLARLLGIALLVALLAVGCAPFRDVPDQHREWDDEYVSATRLGDDEAKRKLADLAERAPDEEKRRDALFDLARLHLNTGDIDAAGQQFQTLVDDNPDDRVASRAIYELGRIAAEHDGDHAEARRLLHTAIVDTTPWAGAELALDFLVRIETDRGEHRRLVDDLPQLADDTDDDRMAAQLHLERGLALDDHLDRADDALQAFRNAYRRCDDCAATDEALYQMANIYVRHQNWQPAVEALQIVADRTQRSWFIGTYSSHRASDARFLLGEIELLYRRDYDAARDHFEQYLDWFDNHPDAHRAAWHLVAIERFDGTERSYRRALQQFIDDYPRSRFVDDARRQLAEVT